MRPCIHEFFTECINLHFIVFYLDIVYFSNVKTFFELFIGMRTMQILLSFLKCFTKKHFSLAYILDHGSIKKIVILCFNLHVTHDNVIYDLCYHIRFQKNK